MSALDLDPIKARVSEVSRVKRHLERLDAPSHLDGRLLDKMARSAGDVPALVAEVERLRAENASLRAGRSHRATEEAQR